MVFSLETSSSRYSSSVTIHRIGGTPSGPASYISSKGEVVIPPTVSFRVPFGSRLFFREGLADVGEVGKMGYVDLRGELVIKPNWFDTFGFYEGLATVTDSNLNHYYINRDGTVVIRLDSWSGGHFSEGLAAVAHEGKRGYIDRTGKLVIPAVWDEVTGVAKPSKEFREGRAIVSQHSQWGFIDRTGKLVVDALWDEVDDFDNGLCSVRRDGKFGVIDRNGKVIIPPVWDEPVRIREGLAAVKKGGKWGFIDRTGQLVIPAVWDESWGFVNGLAIVKKDGKWGFVDRTGKVVIPAVWDDAKLFWVALAKVKREGKWGFIDRTGKVVIPVVWDYAEDFNRSGIAAIFQRLRAGDFNKDDEPTPARMLYIDKGGKIIWSSDGRGVGEIATPGD